MKQTLENKGYTVSQFATAKEAADYLDKTIDGVSVGFGGSVTLVEMGLYDRLAGHNTVYWHWKSEDMAATRAQAAAADVYLSSVNGIARTGEIVNIDGTGNRVAATFYGPRKLYLIVGKNKIADDYEGALWRARNIAAPLNAKRLGVKTPCVKGGRCFDCNSPDRICRQLAVFWQKPMGADIEIVLIDENLGY